MSRHARTEVPPSWGARFVVGVVAAVLAALVVALAAGRGDLQWFGAIGPDRNGVGTPVSPASQDPSPTPSPTPTPTPTPVPDAEFTIVAAGDVLTHQPVNISARSDDGYDFGPLLEPVRPWVDGADLALCHLEVPVAPEGTAPSGYPLFGAPRQIVADLAAQGWDGCSTASNHSVDRGMAGVVATLEAMDEAGLGHVGTARSELEGRSPQFYRLQQGPHTVRVAHLAVTYGTNGMPVPEAWAVSLIDTDRIVADARAARAAGADIVAVSVHCCVEYTTTPTDEQVQIATDLAASGVVDLIIGHHAHVPQPIELLPGGPDGTGMWVAYGLGNFLSNQHTECCAPGADTGVLMTATVRASVDAPPRVIGVEWTGVTVDRAGGHRVHAIPDVLADGVGQLSGAELERRQARLVDVVDGPAPERTSPPSPAGAPVVALPRPR